MLGSSGGILKNVRFSYMLQQLVASSCCCHLVFNDALVFMEPVHFKSGFQD